MVIDEVMGRDGAWMDWSEYIPRAKQKLLLL
jgi:hypothetical protein